MKNKESRKWLLLPACFIAVWLLIILGTIYNGSPLMNLTHIGNFAVANFFALITSFVVLSNFGNERQKQISYIALASITVLTTVIACYVALKWLNS
jgi:hypothetical protein